MNRRANHSNSQTNPLKSAKSGTLHQKVSKKELKVMKNRGKTSKKRKTQFYELKK
jgi:hypothetical protein